MNRTNVHPTFHLATPLLPPSKFSRQIFGYFSYFAHYNMANKWRKIGAYRKIVGSIFEKISLANRKISKYAYSLAEKFFLAIFNSKFN